MGTQAFSMRGIGLVLLLLILGSIFFPATAGGAPLATPQPTAEITSPLFADGWGLGRFLSSAESFLADRRRMIQFAVIGMCIGLYILMRK
jgi:hypothetical protein